MGIEQIQLNQTKALPPASRSQLEPRRAIHSGRHPTGYLGGLNDRRKTLSKSIRTGLDA
jgi:hypothetical protein